MLQNITECYKVFLAFRIINISDMSHLDLPYKKFHNTVGELHSEVLVYSYKIYYLMILTFGEQFLMSVTNLYLKITCSPGRKIFAYSYN